MQIHEEQVISTNQIEATATSSQRQQHHSLTLTLKRLNESICSN